MCEEQIHIVIIVVVILYIATRSMRNVSHNKCEHLPIWNEDQDTCYPNTESAQGDIKKGSRRWSGMETCIGYPKGRFMNVKNEKDSVIL